MNPPVSAGRIPLNVFVSALASVTAGLAKDVDAVNQYAAVMYAPTTTGTADGLLRTHPQTTATRPNVATNSAKSRFGPLLARVEIENTGSANIACATAVPATAPAH
jgi:hypothetical protein